MLINKWSGNGTSDISLYEPEFDDLYNFYIKHNKKCYIWGDGKIGSSLNHYLVQSGMTTLGFVKSDSFGDFKEIYKDCKPGIIIGVSEKNYNEIKPLILSCVSNDDVFVLPEKIRENIGYHFSLDEIERYFWLNIFVTNICNLNCKCCSTFAPICKSQPDFYTFDNFKNDLKEFKSLGFDHLNVLKFTGGEPFLHKKLLNLFEAGREIYPDTTIECYTNGVIPTRLSDEDIKRIADLNVNLVITEYPLTNLRLEKFYETADKAGLKYNIIFSEGIKYFSKRPLNFDRSTPKYKFVSCPRYKFCDSLFMFKSKLYKCIYTFASQYFNNAFGTDLQVSKFDYLDLNNITKKDVFEFCRTRIPFCGYCSPIAEKVSWELSKGGIDEWT